MVNLPLGDIAALRLVGYTNQYAGFMDALTDNGKKDDVDEGQHWVVEGDGVWLVRARTPLEDFEAEVGVELTTHEDIDEEEIDTLGGLVFMLAGHVPARGEVIPHPEGIEVEGVDADPRRIKRLRVRTKPGA